MRTPIHIDDTAGTLTERLADLGATALLETLPCLAAGAVRPEPQDHTLATFAPKIDRATARIDWENARAPWRGRSARSIPRRAPGPRSTVFVEAVRRPRGG